MRTEGDHIRINEWLLPLSWVYRMGVSFRNHLFDIGILKSQAFDIPIISVGNITVGGTGKTPHVEYLIRLLHSKVQLAVLSRGYKRKSKGYQLATDSTEVQDIGDEPYQMKKKFPDVYVAVEKKRVKGIERLTSDEETKNVDVILLDDAFQHRYVKPGINILLIDYHRLISYDKLLPAGRLREPKESKVRADIVIITKCPKDLKPMEFRVLTKSLSLMTYQDLYFTTLEYDRLKPVFNPENSEMALEQIPKDTSVLLLTGIAAPKQLEVDLKGHCRNIKPLTFPDHHMFTHKDISKINQQFADMQAPKMIITTEKDMTRLYKAEDLSDEVKDHLFVLPVKVSFMLNQEEQFNHKILSYVQKNSRNSILVKGKDENKSSNSNRAGHGTRTISFRNN